MSATTKIQWCDSTINPTMGCDGCELWTGNRRSCYAGFLHETIKRGGRPGYAPTFEQVTKFPGRIAGATHWPSLTGLNRLGPGPHKPWLSGSPRLIFVSDMSDALSRAISFEYLYSEIVANVVTPAGQRHRWLWLTKQAKRMGEFSRWLTDLGESWPTNLWVGTSVTSSGTRGRIKDLLSVGDEHTTRFLSVEPQLDPITIGSALPELDWVIQGGESGSDPRPFDLAWARALRDECREADVPYFLKQLGAYAIEDGKRSPVYDPHGGNWLDWPRDLAIREVPGVDRKWSRP